MTRAFSYTRFSTPEQATGDSLRRQTELAEQYCARHGLTLDASLTLHDAGVSGYRGLNLHTGNLGLFRRLVEEGRVPPGSVLLIENWDRLGRLPAIDALTVLRDIVRHGVDVVTLQDNRRHSLETLSGDFGSLITTIVTMQLAHEESAKKSKRMLAVWGEKQRRAAEGKAVTARTPGWLSLDKETGKFSVIEEQAETVRMVYRLYAEGTGQDKIARTLNEAGRPTLDSHRRKKPNPGTLWRKSSVHKLLVTDTVIGTYTPTTSEEDPTTRKLTRVAREPVPNYYPAIIDPALNDQVKAMLAGKPSKARGRDAYGLRSMLGGICYCSRCGSSVTRRVVGRPGAWARLVCTAAKGGKGCTYETAHQGYVESALIANLPRILASRPTGTPSAEARQVELLTNLDGANEMIETLLDELARQPSTAIRERLRELEAAKVEIEAELDKLSTDIAATSLRTPEYDPAVPSSVNAMLRAVFKRIELDLDHGCLLFWFRGYEDLPPETILIPELYGKKVFGTA